MLNEIMDENGRLRPGFFLSVKHIAKNPKTGYPGLLPYSAAAFWRRISEGEIPKPIKLSRRQTVWRSEDIQKVREKLFEIGDKV